MNAAAASAPPPSFAVRGVDRAYGSRAVLAGVDLVRERPGVVGLLGANGAGKTTLLRVVAQLVEPDAGEVEVCGRVIERADDPVARRLVGWAPHEPLAWRDDSVERNLRYAGRLAGLSRAATHQATRRVLEAWGLDDVAGSAVRLLSRGWAQRYSLARADLLAPPVLLLDEPTTGLDAAARTMLEAALDAWRPTRVVVVASHERDWLAERCDALLDLDAAAAAAGVPA